MTATLAAALAAAPSPAAALTLLARHVTGLCEGEVTVR
jgi:hypothetical protein